MERGFLGGKPCIAGLPHYTGKIECQGLFPAGRGKVTDLENRSWWGRGVEKNEKRLATIDLLSEGEGGLTITAFRLGEGVPL